MIRPPVHSLILSLLRPPFLRCAPSFLRCAPPFLRCAPSSRLRAPVVVFALAVMVTLAGTLAACGLRTPVRPPELTAPIVPGVLTAIRDGDATVVRWKRAQRSADGERLEDLTAFVVERKRNGEELWQRVATIDVIDQEKIRRRHDFSWRDAEAGSAGASYRVMAVCSDGQEGPPTEPAVVTDQPTPATANSAIPAAVE